MPISSRWSMSRRCEKLPFDISLANSTPFRIGFVIVRVRYTVMKMPSRTAKMSPVIMILEEWSRFAEDCIAMSTTWFMHSIALFEAASMATSDATVRIISSSARSVELEVSSIIAA